MSELVPTLMQALVLEAAARAGQITHKTADSLEYRRMKVAWKSMKGNGWFVDDVFGYAITDEGRAAAKKWPMDRVLRHWQREIMEAAAA